VNAGAPLRPAAGPPWLAPLLDNIDQVPEAYRRRVPPEVLTALTDARGLAQAARSDRDAAVLVLLNLVVDVLYAMVDPRVRYGKR
jgi:hypothetical protein